MVLIITVLFTELLVSSIIHELGHIFLLIHCQIKIYRLSFGIGPIIWKRKNKKSPIRHLVLRAIPLQASAAFDEDDINFVHASFLKRVLMIGAGCIFNFFAAAIVYFISGIRSVRPLSDLESPLNITTSFIALNLLLGLFNLIPFGNLDGNQIFEQFTEKYLYSWSRISLFALRFLITLCLCFLIIDFYKFWI